MQRISNESLSILLRLCNILVPSCYRFATDSLRLICLAVPSGSLCQTITSSVRVSLIIDYWRVWKQDITLWTGDENQSWTVSLNRVKNTLFNSSVY